MFEQEGTMNVCLPGWPSEFAEGGICWFYTEYIEPVNSERHRMDIL